MKVDVIELREKFTDPHHLVKTSDGKTLFLRRWGELGSSEENIKKNRTALLLFHGITAHSEPYKMIGIPLSEAGYTTFGLDYRGHGLSDGIRGDYPSKQRFIDDLVETIKFVKSLGFQNLVILGHSLGVGAAVFAAQNDLEDISGLALFSGGNRFRHGVYKPATGIEKFKIILNTIFVPSKPIIGYKREGMVGLDDPLFNFKYSVRFMKMINFATITIPKNLNIPVFMGIGENDELFSVDSAKAFFDMIPGDNKRFYVIKGGKHAEFPEGSWHELINWMKENFPQ